MRYLPTLVLTAALASAFFFPAQLKAAGGGGPIANPDFTSGEKIPEGATHDWNLGPTGARGWIYSNKLETSEARQIYVTEVETGSPADGILGEGDVILGVVGEKFSYDPRTELGKAIGQAEAAGGELALIRWRKGKTDTVVIPLEVLGAYAPTAPFDCPKSRLIFEKGCKAIARQMSENPEQGNGIVRSLNALALLASGNPEYLPLVREQVEWASQYSDLERKTLHAWFYGPINILIAEYTLATGDRTFMPDLERVTMEIVHGQSDVGSWGHRFVTTTGRLSGYGMMNAPGIPLTTSLLLAREAGIKSTELDDSIEKSLRLLRFYAGKGSIPYGDHHPWIQTHEDNGKNGMAAVMFQVAGEPKTAQYFSKMSVASYGAERETGHTGNFFNMLWAMPGVALSGPNASGSWMNEFGWYYDLARRWDWSFRHQGPPATKPDKYSKWDTTGSFLLAYAQASRKLHMTGKNNDVAGYLDTETAAGLIEDGRGWGPRTKSESYSDRTVEQLFNGLRNWSPVVRERSAIELARRDGDHVPKLVTMLKEGDLSTRIGVCQAFVMLKGRGAPAVSALNQALESEDLWLRVKAAEALAGIGDAAMPIVPRLLEMLSRGPSEADPRGMEQRYLCFALFDRRNGLLKRSLDGVDREALYAGVRAGLQNEDGRARGVLGSVYGFLTYEEIEPILPAIYESVVKPAPSGIMFADGIRLTGLGILAKHRIEEGLPLCLEVMNIEAWGKKGRINKCLKALQSYGGSASELLPELENLEGQLQLHREAKSLQGEVKLVRETIEVIQADENPAPLRPLF